MPASSPPKVERSKYRPSKKLLDHIATLIEGKPEYVLLDEQLVVYDKVIEAAEHGVNGRKKLAIIVRGRPGTGKSVIAMNLLGDLSRRELNAHYVTGSRAFTSTIREIVGPRGSAQVRFFNSYMEADVNVVDVIIADEAHRIRESSNNRFTPSVRRTKVPQVRELLKAGKTSVFFIDDNQIVRPGEIGSSAYIRVEAESLGIEVREFELEAQLRCAGSDAFVSWVNNTLGVKRTPHVILTPADAFDFRIMVAEGCAARVTAGFCWKWSKDQVGCVYTAQGFEFDYVGVIVGPDLVYVPETGDWRGDKTKSHDRVVRAAGEQFTSLVLLR